MDYIDPAFRDSFTRGVPHDPQISIEREVQIGRFSSCRARGRSSSNGMSLSERVFIGDNNHTFSHPDVLIVQQPNKPGDPVVIGQGSWLAVGAAIRRAPAWPQLRCRREQRVPRRGVPVPFGHRSGAREAPVSPLHARCRLTTRRDDEFYRQRDPEHVYPVEFVVRAYLGSYPRLPRSERPFAGARVLDLVAETAATWRCSRTWDDRIRRRDFRHRARTTERMRRLGVTVDARVGRNQSIPFDDRFFDQVLACHSCATSIPARGSTTTPPRLPG
jgi:hypothetical protein